MRKRSLNPLLFIALGLLQISYGLKNKAYMVNAAKFHFNKRMETGLFLMKYMLFDMGFDERDVNPLFNNNQIIHVNSDFPLCSNLNKPCPAIRTEPNSLDKNIYRGIHEVEYGNMDTIESKVMSTVTGRYHQHVKKSIKNADFLGNKLPKNR